VETFEDEGKSDDTRFGLPLTAFTLALKRGSTSISIPQSTDVLPFIKSQPKGACNVEESAVRTV
jgi:hypothetical protein